LRDQAQEVIDEHVGADELDDIRDNVDAIEVEATERIEAIKTEIEDRVTIENERLQEMVAEITLPPAPALPEAELAERPPDSVLVSSDWDWADQTRALKRQKSYGAGEGEP
jgi:hypothetical protein